MEEQGDTREQYPPQQKQGADDPSDVRIKPCWQWTHAPLAVLRIRLKAKGEKPGPFYHPVSLSTAG